MASGFASALAACDDLAAPETLDAADVPEVSDAAPGPPEAASPDAVVEPDAEASGPCPELAPPDGAPASRWDPADPEAPVPLRLNLPLAPGAEVTVTQGPDGALSHFGDQRFAWDFDVPVGTRVFAPAGGLVVDVVADSATWGTDPSLRNLANRVILDHGRGLFSASVHLAAGEVAVAPGQWVAAGDLLGHTGLSGQMTGPHLHFHVENVWSETRPARFFGGPEAGCSLALAAGDTVRVPDIAFFSDATEPSPLPPDTFAEFGVDAVRGLPARVFREGEALTIGGIATDPQATHVHLLMLPPEGGMALGVWSLAIATDRSFAGEVAPGDLGLGRYAWALAAGAIDSARVTRSVRCVVVAADEDVAGP